MKESTENTGNGYQDSPGQEQASVLPRPSLSNGFPGLDVAGPALLKDSIFSVEDPHTRSALPKVTHWSIAWSDLMMTMFVLFLSMFVYQAAHKEFLVSDELEVIGGDSVEAVEMADSGRAAFPFVPIKPGRPLVSNETVKRVEPVQLQDIDVDTAFFDEKNKGGLDRIRASLDKPVEPEQKAEAETVSTTAGITGDQASLETEEDKRINEIFTMDKEDISRLGLKNFASIDLVPDKTMRIILTGDLLFETGRAELNSSSVSSLRKIAAVIKNTPYMINVIGHTDNIPMSSERYPTNWELSVARASTVARFLIEEMKMNPRQFIVSGYSSYRPVKPNTNSRNMAANRRVEIIISKRLPAPVAASADNIN